MTSPSELGHTPNQSPSAFTILYVEDHADTLRVTSKLLRLGGYEVCVAPSYKEAVECVEQLSRVDLLIADLKLPDGNGWDLLGELRLRFPKMCAIALSGYDLLEDVEKSRLVGFDRHISKPISFELLLTTMTEVLSAPCGSDPTDQLNRDKSSAIRRLSS